MGDSLEPGNSALCALVYEANEEKVLPELRKLGGTVFQTSLSAEAEARLKEILEHGDVRDAAEESLELT